jgi:hypothetical protein
MSSKISSSFPLEWTLVALGQKLNHVMHKTSVRLQMTLLCKSSLALIVVEYTLVDINVTMTIMFKYT